MLLSESQRTDEKDSFLFACGKKDDLTESEMFLVSLCGMKYECIYNMNVFPYKLRLSARKIQVYTFYKRIRSAEKVLNYADATAR